MNKQSFIVLTPDGDYYQVIYQRIFYPPVNVGNKPTLHLTVYQLEKGWSSNSVTSTLVYADYKAKEHLDSITYTDSLDVEDKYNHLFSMSFHWRDGWNSKVYLPLDNEEYLSSDIVKFGQIIPEIEYQCKLILSEYDEYLLSKLDECV